MDWRIYWLYGYYFQPRAFFEKNLKFFLSCKANSPDLCGLKIRQNTFEKAAKELLMGFAPLFSFIKISN